MAQLSPAGNAAALRYSKAEQRFDQLAAEARKEGNEAAARGSEIHAGWCHRAALAEMRDPDPAPREPVVPDVLIVTCTHPRQLAGRCLVCGEMAR
jgi:hypothetical protein